MSRAILNEAMKQPFGKSYTPKEKTSNFPFIFPKPPSHIIRTASHCNCEPSMINVPDADSNSENESPVLLSSKPVDVSRLLPPIGVFWDIENCQVPKRKSAGAIAQVIRDRFFDGYREAEFVVVCDVTKESSRVIKELNYAQVNLIHVSATSKNAADEKLRQSIRRFADIHNSPAAIILISSDINFAGDLSDLRHRKKIHVILLHNENISEALILCANEHYNFNEIIEIAVCRRELREPDAAVEIMVSNLPKEVDLHRVKNRLKQLCYNLGGRVCLVSDSLCSIRFPTLEFATRAQKRMAGEDVFGSKINVSNPISVDEWGFHSGGNSKIHMKEDSQACYCTNRKAKDENNFQFNDICSQKQIAEVNSSGLSNMEPIFQQQISKNIVPFFSNNTSKFTFSKIPNIENLKIIQNPTSTNQKSYLNNSETYAGILGNDADQRKQHLENRKLNNFFTNQQECSSLRLNNSTSSSSESGMNSVDNNQLLLAQAQKLQLLAQNALIQRNLAHTAALAQHLAAAQINRTNGSIDSAAGRVIRGVHGGSTNDSSNNNNINNNNNNNNNNNSNNNIHNNNNNGNNICNSSSNGINNNSNINNSSSNNNNKNSNASSSSTENIASRITPIEEDCESIVSADDFFEPTQKSVGSDCNSPVDLHISGLDPYMGLMMTKNFLTSMFKMHVEVLSVSVFCLTDGNVVASVKVPTLQDAQYAISQLQRRQIGSRRINIAFQNSSKYHRQLIRSQVAQLLSELPKNKTPLFRFTELFKSRFLNPVSVSELKKMKDVCVISEEETGRMISANTRCQINSLQRQEKKEAIIPYCPVHAQKTLSDSEPSDFPTVRIGLSILNKRIEKLLDSHGGKLPLPSLSDCYEAQFGPLPEDSQGVPLEHLVSCIPGIEIAQSQGSFKYLTWSTAAGQANDEHAKCVSPMLVATMSVFTRELLELLKDTPKCILPFSQFIPSYHRRYGRQCRVSDYGYTKLLDLLESLPHVLQVIGNGSYKMVTLSHKAQIRRFTSDLLRILKSQTNKQLELCNFQSQYEKIIGRAWDPCHYGLCELEDLLNCIPQSTVMKDTKEGQVVISIPKREQTPEEIELTKKFAQEVVELLKRVPNCSMAFNRFVPAYHNQFGRQCRVSSYGCFKLIELFEAIPDTVVIEENASRGEKYVILTPAKRLQVLAERVCQILAAEGGTMPLIRLEFIYKFYQYESVISPSDYGCDSFEELLTKIPQYVKIEDSRNGRKVVLKNEMDPNVLIRRIRYILLDSEKLPVSHFVKAYAKQYGYKIDVSTIVNKVPEVVKLIKKGGESYIQLTSLSVFANQMYLLLVEHRGRISLPNFESAYLNKFKKSCQPSQFGFPTLSSLLSAIPETVTVQNSGYYTHRRIITLNTGLKCAGFQMPVLNNENYSQKSLFDGSLIEEKLPRTYDLWKSDSLFPSWKDINRFIPENITVPHPSELPLPSPKLSSPFRKMMQTDSESENSIEATSTTFENVGEVVDPTDCKAEMSKDLTGKRKSRIAAQFQNNMT